MKKSIHCFGCIILTVTTSPILSAQTSNTTSIEEILVTAQRRQESMENVPITITSINSEILRQNNVQQLADIVQLTPGVRFDYNANFVQPTVRGIGTAVVTAGGTSNVGIYIDGFYSANPLAADMELLNVDSVQVLKGPQGTLFGRNTTGGAILVTTSEPSRETRAIAEISHSRFNSSGIKGYFTTGLTDNVAVDLAAGYRSSDGYTKNIIPTGPDDPGRYENWSVRTGIKLDLNENVSLLFRYSHHNVDDSSNMAVGSLKQDGESWAAGSGADFWPFPTTGIPTRFREVAQSGEWVRPRFQLESDIFQLTGEVDLEFASLVSYTQYREDDTVQFYDQDGTVHPLLYSEFYIRDKTFTQEFLLSSTSESKLLWTAGLYYFNYKNTFMPINFSLFGAPFFTIAGSSATVETLAGYLDITYEVMDRLFLTVGGRYSRDEFVDSWADVFDFNAFELNRVFPNDISDNKFIPRAVVRYELDNGSLYASYTQGYKASIIDLPRPGGPADIEPEEVDAFEVGYKYASGPLAFNIAAWYYDYQDLQVSTYPQGLAMVNNAASADIYGVETDLRYQLTADLTVNFGAAWVHSEYDKFPDASRFTVCSDTAVCGDAYGLLITQGFDASGLKMQRSPKLTATLGAQYERDIAYGRLTLSGNLYHSSKVYFDQAEQFYDDGYTLFNVRTEWTDPSETYNISLYDENITNEKYYKQININNYGATTVWGTPASWGVSLRVNF